MTAVPDKTAADPFALMSRSMNRGGGYPGRGSAGSGYPGRGAAGRGRGRGRRLDPDNPKDREYLRSMHPDFDELMGNANVDYRTMCNRDANFADKFRMPPIIEPVRSFNGHMNSVDAVCWGPESGTFLSASHDKTIKVWDAAAGKCLQTLSGGHAGGVFHCAVSSTLKQFVSCGAGDSKNLFLWQWPKPESKNPAELEGHRRSVYHATFASDGKLIASTDQEGYVIVHDITRAAPVSSRQLHLGVCDGSSFCRQDSNLLCSVGHDSQVQMTDLRESHTKAVWNMPSMAANGTFRTSLSIPDGHDEHPIYGVEFVDSATVFTCGADHKLKCWDLRMAPWDSKSAEYLGHSAPIRSLTVSPDKRFVATGCEDGACRVWRTDDKLPTLARPQRKKYGSASATLIGHVGLVSGCAWQDDKENDKASMLSCSWDQSIKLFQLNLKDM